VGYQVACTRWCCKRLSRRANVLPHPHAKAAKTPPAYQLSRSPAPVDKGDVRFSYVCNDSTCRLRCSARAKLLEQPGTVQTCVRSCVPSESGTLRPRLFFIRCGTGMGGGIRLRCDAWALFGSGSGVTDMAPETDVHDASSSSDVSSLLATRIFFAAAGASTLSPFSSFPFLFFLACA
jgi:hypothetical protein